MFSSHPKQAAVDQALERGQGLVEYALILIMVAIAVIVILSQVSGGLGGIFEQVQCQLSQPQGFVGYANQYVTGSVQAPANTLLMAYSAESAAAATGHLSNLLVGGKLLEATSAYSGTVETLPDAFCLYRTANFVDDGTANDSEYAFMNPFDVNQSGDATTNLQTDWAHGPN